MSQFLLMTFMVLGLLSVVYAEAKLTPLKTGGGKPLESLKAKKEQDKSSSLQTAAPKKDSQPPEPVFKGPKSGWGIVNQACRYYSLEGDNQGALPPGTLLTYSAVKHASKNFVLVAKIQRASGKWEGPCLLEVPDVVIFSGDFSEMPETLVANIRAYYTIKGQIASRKEEIEDAAQARNPHYESAKLWQQRYADSIEKASEMEERAANLKGPAKSKLLDDLRALKYEQARLKIQADKEAANYKAWKDQNPVSPTLISTDATLKTLQAQLKEAKEKIKDVVIDD